MEQELSDRTSLMQTDAICAYGGIFTTTWATVTLAKWAYRDPLRCGLSQNKYYAFDVNCSIFVLLIKLFRFYCQFRYSRNWGGRGAHIYVWVFKRSRLPSRTKMFTPLSFMRPKCPSHLPNYILKLTNNEASQVVLSTLLTLFAHVQLFCTECLTNTLI